MRDVALLVDRDENKMLLNTMNTLKKRGSIQEPQGIQLLKQYYEEAGYNYN